MKFTSEVLRYSNFEVLALLRVRSHLQDDMRFKPSKSALSAKQHGKIGSQLVCSS